MLRYLLVLLALCGAHSVDAKASDLPKWVVPRAGYMFKTEWRRNIRAIRAIDAKKEQMDVAVYGDSIIAWNKPFNLPKNPATRLYWDRWFGDLNAEPLAISGDRIANLMWRLSKGNETPNFASPKVIIIFIGINDVLHNNTANIYDQMNYVLKFMRKEMPKSKIILQALLPSLEGGIPANMAYARLAMEHKIFYSNCMQDVTRGNAKYMHDDLHPTAAGQNKLLMCLRRLIQPLLDATPPLPSSSPPPKENIKQSPPPKRLSPPPSPAKISNSPEVANIVQLEN